MLGTTITLKTEADSHSAVLALGSRRQQRPGAGYGARRGQPSLSAQGALLGTAGHQGEQSLRVGPPAQGRGYPRCR